MFRTAVTILAMSLLGALPLDRGLAADREKVEEGRYAVLKNGGLVEGTEHSWTLWRLPDGGYELEDHVGSDAKLPMPPELANPETKTLREARKLLEESVLPSDIDAIYGPDWQLLSLNVSGKKANNDLRNALKCNASRKTIECTGIKDRTELSQQASRGLFWWYRIPMLLRPWLSSAQGIPTTLGSTKIAMLTFSFGSGIQVMTQGTSWGDLPHLEPADLNVAGGSEDTLTVGNRTFHALKYSLDFKPAKGDPLSLIAWTDAKGVILAVADGGAPGEMVALVQYKKYPSATTSAPAQK